MSDSDYLEKKLLDHVLGGPDYVRPATVYVSLHTADPTDAGGGAEATGSGYARKSVTNDSTNWPAATGTAPTTKSNGTTVTFAAATGDWSSAANMTHFGVWDAATSGNLLKSGALQTPKPVLNGDTANFPAGTLSFTHD